MEIELHRAKIVITAENEEDSKQILAFGSHARKNEINSSTTWENGRDNSLPVWECELDKI